MTEVLFYHLQNAPLERVLPDLLERSLQRGWRAIVRAGGKERLEALNNTLWTYRDDSFLPHGTAEDGPPESRRTGGTLASGRKCAYGEFPEPVPPNA